MKSILVLGAGLVSRPLVDYLLNKGYNLTVATRTVSKAEKLIQGHPQGKAIPLNVQDADKLEELVQEHDISVSLLPYTYHVQVANLCIKHKKHLVTTSYVSPAMSSLDEKAKEAGVILLNEIGLDPGIDHMSAMEIIDEVKGKGGTITSFESYCGGLPAPDCNDNPFGYKFSWSPRGVLMAGKNNAKFLKDRRIIEIPGRLLFDNYWTLDVEGLGTLEGYPNRDSVPYKETYHIENTKTMFRGTFRNPGWCSAIKKLSELGYLEDSDKDIYQNITLKKLTALLLGDGDIQDVKSAVCEKLAISCDSHQIHCMEWLGLFDDIPTSPHFKNPMDILCVRMQEMMDYKPGEKDMIVLHHLFTAEYPDGRIEKITATLIDYGIPHGDSAMSRTVSLPAAIAVDMMAKGEITQPGVHIPVTPGVYVPVLRELAGMNIVFKVKRSIETAVSVSEVF